MLKEQRRLKSLIPNIIETISWHNNKWMRLEMMYD